MTRNPRLYLNSLTRRIRQRLPTGLRSGGLSRKKAACAGAGLALAGVVGAMAPVGFSGQQASTAGARHAVKRTVRADVVKRSPVPAKHGAAPAKHGAAPHHEETWAAVTRIVAQRTVPQPGNGQLPARDRLTPAGISGPQARMSITPARYQNAKTIVRQVIGKHMGLRSAVIAVATAMQESTLLNLPYGDQDSLGLFQQRPSSGWGTAGQIQHPAYAAKAFLGALRSYQAQNPGWAHQPLWEPAQGVQRSAFPSAYAKWEAQAAQLVASVTKRLI
jgi:hypothetical protein